MTKSITLKFTFDDDEFQEWLNGDNPSGEKLTEDQISDYIFGEMCQNQGFGFLVSTSIGDIDD